MVDELQSRQPTVDPERAFLLGVLTEDFDLAPWPDVGGRLDELQARYAADIVWTPWVG